MPGPLEVLLDPVSLAITGLYALLMVWEAFFPARRLPAVPFWKIKGITCFFRLLKNLPDAGLIIYEGTGHALHWEDPQRFVNDVVGFIHGRFH